MKILKCKKAPFVTIILLLMLLVSTFVQPAVTLAEEVDFPAGSQREALVKEAIEFIKDNEGTNNTTADEDLTAMLGTNATDGTGKKQLREETGWPLGRGGANSARIRVGLPPEANVTTDITTAEGFRQVKTLAQTLYHEWVHWKQFQAYGDDAYYACQENWQDCEPFWLEVEAYYKEIKLKLQWKLAREQRLAQIPGGGTIFGPPTAEQQAEIERLQREVVNLTAQIDDVINNYLDPKRQPNALNKSYEDNGNHLKAAFQGKTNQQKYNEVVARLNNVTKIDPNQPQQTIDQKIAVKVIEYRLLKLLEELLEMFSEGKIKLFVTEGEYSHFFEMTVHEGTLYEPTCVTIAYISPEFMDPWNALGYTILSPVYQVSSLVGAMANPAHPATVTLSYNEELAGGLNFHLYRMCPVDDGRSLPGQERPLWEALPGEAIDYDARTISGDSDNPFSLYVVMVEPEVSPVELPTITSITPDHGNQDETLDVIITGTNFDGATEVIFGAGITVNSFNVDSSTQITANIIIDQFCEPGPRTIEVTTPIDYATLEDGFTVELKLEEGCFISTAAYGTPVAEEIDVLRDFRDQYLLTNPMGEALVKLYYKVSPPIAEFITDHPALKPVVRAGLVPAIAMSTVAVNTTPVEKMAIIGLLVLVSVAPAVWTTRRRGRVQSTTNGEITQ